MSKREAEHKHLSSILSDFINENALTNGLDEVNVKNSWYAIMGSAIGNYTTSIQFKNSTLYVQLSSSVLREELSYGIEKIIKNLNDELGEEKVLKLVLR